MKDEFDFEGYKAQLRDNVPEDMRVAYDKLVAAGMKFMFDKKTNQKVMQFLQGQGAVDDKLGMGVVQLMAIIATQAQGAVPQALIIPAGIELILHAAEFIDKAGIDDIDAQIIASAIQKFVFGMAQAAGISEEELIGGIDKLEARAQGGGNGQVIQG